MAAKVEAVEIGIVFEHLDPERKYEIRQINPVLEQLSEIDSTKNAVYYIENVGWAKKTIFGKAQFDTAEELTTNGFAADRTDICTLYMLIGEGMTAQATLLDYATQEVLLKYTVDSTGLIIDETAGT